MILAISNNNEKLIREICAKFDYDEIEVYSGIKNLQEFAIRELQILAGKELNKGMFQYGGIDIYTKDEKISAIAYGYDVYIYDYGVLTDNNINLFLKNDKRIIVGGSKLWEIRKIFLSFERLKDFEDVYYIISHCPVDDKNALTTNMQKFKKKTFFSEYAPDPFENNKNTEIYLSIFKDNIAEKNTNMITVEKNNIFSFLKRKK